MHYLNSRTSPSDPSDSMAEALRAIANLVLNAGTAVLAAGPVAGRGEVLMAIVPNPEQQWLYSGHVASRMLIPAVAEVLPFAQRQILERAS